MTSHASWTRIPRKEYEAHQFSVVMEEILLSSALQQAIQKWNKSEEGKGSLELSQLINEWVMVQREAAFQLSREAYLSADSQEIENASVLYDATRMLMFKFQI